jgi:hypothetical protein
MHTFRTAVLAPLLLLLLATAANAQYVGVTAETFDGAAGSFAINRACHAAHPGSRICTTEEIAGTVNPPVVGSPGELAWVKTTDPAWPLSSYNCEDWTTIDGSGVKVSLDDGELIPFACQFPSPIACCIPVPEPSAALSIPSGAAMVLALAKLRGVGLGHSPPER